MPDPATVTTVAGLDTVNIVVGCEGAGLPFLSVGVLILCHLRDIRKFIY